MVVVIVNLVHKKKNKKKSFYRDSVLLDLGDSPFL